MEIIFFYRYSLVLRYLKTIFTKKIIFAQFTVHINIFLTLLIVWRNILCNGPNTTYYIAFIIATQCHALLCYTISITAMRAVPSIIRYYTPLIIVIVLKLN